MLYPDAGTTIHATHMKATPPGWTEDTGALSFYTSDDMNSGVTIYLDRAQMYRVRDLLTGLLAVEPRPYPGTDVTSGPVRPRSMLARYFRGDSR